MNLLSRCIPPVNFWRIIFFRDLLWRFLNAFTLYNRFYNDLQEVFCHVPRLWRLYQLNQFLFLRLIDKERAGGKAAGTCFLDCIAKRKAYLTVHCSARNRILSRRAAKFRQAR